MTLPVWLLDVDGVLNAPRPGWGAAPFSGSAYVDSTAYRMRWAPGLMERIRAIHAGGLAEIRWCTSWCDYADQLEKLFNLPAFTRAAIPVTNNSFAKLEAVRDVLAENRPLIWTDDAEPWLWEHKFAAELAAGTALFVMPDGRKGLQPKHLLTIENFLRTFSLKAAGHHA